MTDSSAPSEIDLEHLKLLSLFFKFTGIVTAVMISFLLIHFTIFTTIAVMPKSFFNQKVSSHVTTNESDSATATPQNTKPAPEFPHVIFGVLAGIFGVIILLGWTFGALTFYAGRCIQQRKHPTFIFVISCIKCLFVPYGTMLGICTFMVLSRPQVKKLFEPGIA